VSERYRALQQICSHSSHSFIHFSRDVRRCKPIFHLLAECDQHHFTVIRLIGRTVWLSSPALLLLSAFHSNKIKQKTYFDATETYVQFSHAKSYYFVLFFFYIPAANSNMFMLAALIMRQTERWNNSQSTSAFCCRWDKSFAFRSDHLCSRESDGYKADNSSVLFSVSYSPPCV